MWPFSAQFIRTYLGSMKTYLPGVHAGVPWESVFYWNRNRLGDPAGRVAMKARRDATIPTPLRMVLPTSPDQPLPHDRQAPFVACNVPMVEIESTHGGLATEPLPGTNPPTSCVWVPTRPASSPRGERFFYIGTPLQSGCAVAVYATTQPADGFLLCHVRPAPQLGMSAAALGLALCLAPGQPGLAVTGGPQAGPVAVFAYSPSGDDLAPAQTVGPNHTRLLSYAVRGVTMGHATSTGWRFLVQSILNTAMNGTVSGTGVLYPAP